MYPNYSIYLLEGGQLKNSTRSSKRREFFDFPTALKTATNIWDTYKGFYDILILKYTAPYDTTVVHLINRKQK